MLFAQWIFIILDVSQICKISTSSWRFCLWKAESAEVGPDPKTIIIICQFPQSGSTHCSSSLEVRFWTFSCIEVERWCWGSWLWDLLLYRRFPSKSLRRLSRSLYDLPERGRWRWGGWSPRGLPPGSRQEWLGSSPGNHYSQDYQQLIFKVEIVTL